MSKTKSKAVPAARHPLLAAVIGQLPAVGEQFPDGARVAWVRLFVQTLDVAYGPGTAIAVKHAVDPTHDGLRDVPVLPWRTAASGAVQATPAKPERRPHQAAGCDYYVDEQGFARCDHSNADGVAVPTPGRRVSAEEAAEKEIYDYRGARRDRETVTWADDSMGAQPGMVFCGPG